MLTIYIYTFSSVAIVSLISFIGIFALGIKPDVLKKITLILISLSAATLLGDAFLHLIPEALAKNGQSTSIWLWLLAGIFFFFTLEKFICWHHCDISSADEHNHPLGLMNLYGDGLHNFIDGMIIAGSFLINVPVGIATTIAVVAHEIPQEIGDFGVLIHAGYSKGKALFLNFLAAILAIIGASLSLLLENRIENFINFILPFAAGGFIYIATADLIPELKKDAFSLKKTFIQLASIISGFAIMILLKYFG